MYRNLEPKTYVNNGGKEVRLEFTDILLILLVGILILFLLKEIISRIIYSIKKRVNELENKK